MTEPLWRSRRDAFQLLPATEVRRQKINDFIHLSEGLSNSYLIVTAEGRRLDSLGGILYNAIPLAALLERTGIRVRLYGRLGRGDRERAIELLRRGLPILNISEAASFGRLDLIQQMIEEAPGRLEGDGDGFTPLRSAAYYGYPQIVRWLLDRGARVHGINRFGYNAFALARRRRWRSIVAMLQEAGAVPPEEEARMEREIA